MSEDWIEDMRTKYENTIADLRKENERLKKSETGYANACSIWANKYQLLELRAEQAEKELAAERGKVEKAGKLILNYISGPFEFYTPIKPVVLITKETHDELKQILK